MENGRRLTLRLIDDRRYLDLAESRRYGQGHLITGIDQCVGRGIRTHDQPDAHGVRTGLQLGGRERETVLKDYRVRLVRRVVEERRRRELRIGDNT